MAGTHLVHERTTNKHKLINKTHHSLDLGEATTFPPYSILYAGAYTLNVILFWDFEVGFSKFPKLGLLRLWRPITLCADLRLRWGLKQSCSTHWKFSNGMWHATCIQGNQGDSRLFVVENQIGNLTPSPSFGHNLCFKYPTGSCSPILDIWVPRAFQWYKKLFDPMCFDPYNFFLKIWKSIRIPTPKVGAHLGVHSFTFSHTPRSMKCDSWASFLARTFASPCLGCEPKARVATFSLRTNIWCFHLHPFEPFGCNVYLVHYIVHRLHPPLFFQVIKVLSN